MSRALWIVALGVALGGALALVLQPAGQKQGASTGTVRAGPTALPRRPTPPPDRPAARAEAVCRQFWQGELVYDLCADRVEFGLGGVEVRLWNIHDTHLHRPDGSTLSVHHADEGQYNSNTRQLSLKGGIRIVGTSPEGADNLLVEAELLRFLPARDEIVSPGRVKIAMPGIVTYGQRMRLIVGPQKLYFEADVRTIVDLSTGGRRSLGLGLPPVAGATPVATTGIEEGGAVPVPLTITAQRLGYDHRAGVAGYSGSPRVTQGRNTLTALRMVFHLAEPDRRAEILGSVRARLYPDRPLGGQASADEPLELTADRLYIENEGSRLLFKGRAAARYGGDALRAENVEVLMDGGRPRGVLADKRVVVQSRGFEGRGDKAVLNLAEARLTLSGGATIRPQGESLEETGLSAGSITLSGRPAHLVATSDVVARWPLAPAGEASPPLRDPLSLRLGATAGGRALLRADRFEVDEASRWGEATGGARVTDGQRVLTADRVRVGWSEARELVALRATGHMTYAEGERHLAGEALQYDRRDHLWRVEGRAAWWEPARRLTAGVLQYDERTGVLTARGSVHLTMTSARSASLEAAAPSERALGFDLAGGEGPVQVWAEAAEFTPSASGPGSADRVAFFGSARVERDDLSLQAERITLWIARREDAGGAAELTSLTAKDRVRLDSRDGEAAADELYYSGPKNLVLMVGRPARVATSDRETEGRVIRYRLDRRRYTVLADADEAALATYFPGGRPSPTPTAAPEPTTTPTQAP